MANLARGIAIDFPLQKVLRLAGTSSAHALPDGNTGAKGSLRQTVRTFVAAYKFSLRPISSFHRPEQLAACFLRACARSCGKPNRTSATNGIAGNKSVPVLFAHAVDLREALTSVDLSGQATKRGLR